MYSLEKNSQVMKLMRPIFTPCLKISFRSNNNLELSCSQFQEFLNNPTKFIDKQLLDHEYLNKGTRDSFFEKSK